MFNQMQHEPLAVEVQVVVLWMVQNGHLDAVPVERVKDYQIRLTEFLTASKAPLLAAIGREKALNDALIAELQAAAAQFAALAG